MFEKNLQIRFSETGEDGKLSMSGLLRLFQDVGYFHALARGQGHLPGRPTKRTWYLLTWHIEAYEMPVAGDTVTVGTWIYSHGGPTARKQLCMKAQDGKLLAMGDTLWVYMDVAEGCPTVPPEGIWRAEDYGDRMPLVGTVRRLRAGQPTDEGIVQLPHDFVDERLLDINHHANNALFTEYAMSLAGARNGFPFLLVEFRHQARAGAELCPLLSVTSLAKTVTICDVDGGVYAVFQFATDAKQNACSDHCLDQERT